MARAKLGEILVEAGAIDQSQLAAALAEQKEGDRPLGMTLVRMGYLDESVLIRTLAQQLQLPMARLQGKRIPQEVLDLLPFEAADKNRCIPLFIRGEGDERKVFLAMEDPSRTEVIQDLSRRTGLPVQPVLVAPSEVEEALHRYHDLMTVETPSLTPLAAPVSAPVEERRPSLAETTPSPLDPLPEGPPLDPFPEGPTLDAALDFDDDSLGEASSQMLAFEAQPEQPQPALAASGPAVPEMAILRALTQLLIERGVFTRDELIERVHGFASPGGSDD